MRRALLDERLVLNATGPDTVRLLPPLTVAEDEVDEAVRRIGALVGDVLFAYGSNLALDAGLVGPALLP